MSTRSTLLYAGDVTCGPWKEDGDGEVEPYTHIWDDCITGLVSVQVLASDVEQHVLLDEDGKPVGVLVTLTLPKWASGAVKDALYKARVERRRGSR